MNLTTRSIKSKILLQVNVFGDQLMFPAPTDIKIKKQIKRKIHTKFSVETRLHLISSSHLKLNLA